MPKPSRRRILPFLAALAASAAAAYALDPQTPLSEYVKDSWTIENGLPQSSVTALAQTSEGYLWFGTHEGLVRFDGFHFVTFGTAQDLPGKIVTGLAAGPDGSLWVATHSAVSRDRKSVV